MCSDHCNEYPEHASSLSHYLDWWCREKWLNSGCKCYFECVTSRAERYQRNSSMHVDTKFGSMFESLFLTDLCGTTVGPRCSGHHRGTTCWPL